MNKRFLINLLVFVISISEFGTIICASKTTKAPLKTTAKSSASPTNNLTADNKATDTKASVDASTSPTIGIIGEGDCPKETQKCASLDSLQEKMNNVIKIYNLLITVNDDINGLVYNPNTILAKLQSEPLPDGFAINISKDKPIYEMISPDSDKTNYKTLGEYLPSLFPDSTVSCMNLDDIAKTLKSKDYADLISNVDFMYKTIFANSCTADAAQLKIIMEKLSKDQSALMQELVNQGVKKVYNKIVTDPKTKEQSIVYDINITGPIAPHISTQTLGTGNNKIIITFVDNFNLLNIDKLVEYLNNLKFQINCQNEYARQNCLSAMEKATLEQNKKQYDEQTKKQQEQYDEQKETQKRSEASSLGLGVIGALGTPLFAISVWQGHRQSKSAELSLAADAKNARALKAGEGAEILEGLGKIEISAGVAHAAKLTKGLESTKNLITNAKSIEHLLPGDAAKALSEAERTLKAAEIAINKVAVAGEDFKAAYQASEEAAKAIKVAEEAAEAFKAIKTIK